MMRDLHISAVLNGYLVQVGCQRLVFVSKLTLLSELGRYLDNPAGTLTQSQGLG